MMLSAGQCEKNEEFIPPTKKIFREINSTDFFSKTVAFIHEIFV